jgi:hypothetical protein
MSGIVYYEQIVCAVVFACPGHHSGVEGELRIRGLELKLLYIVFESVPEQIGEIIDLNCHVSASSKVTQNSVALLDEHLTDQFHPPT